MEITLLRDMLIGNSMESAGAIIDIDERRARQLIMRRLAAVHTRIEYETKVVQPEAPEVTSFIPFCFMPVPDTEPVGVAAESDSVLPEPVLAIDLTRTPDTRRRRGRPRRSASR